jgi:catechol 2,3-dioxygenase-like lactoylglutathione lyase family enzyme
MTETPLVTAVERLVIAVRDLADAERIYTRILGRSPSWRHENPGGGTAHVLYLLDNIGLELVTPTGDGPWGLIVSRHLEKQGEGIQVLFLATSDAVAATAQLNERGLAAVTLPEGGATSGSRLRRWRSVILPPQFTREMPLIVNEVMTAPGVVPLAPLREGVAEEDAISALDHVVVMTSDAEACKKLFGEQLGIRLALDQSKPEWGVRQLFFRLGGVTIEVVEPLDKEKAPKTDHFWGLAWKAGNVGAVRERLTREGVDVSEVRRGRKKDTEVATIRKPTGGVPTLLVGPVAS